MKNILICKSDNNYEVVEYTEIKLPKYNIILLGSSPQYELQVKKQYVYYLRKRNNNDIIAIIISDKKCDNNTELLNEIGKRLSL
jgi:aspartyl aminopeptidase